MVVRHFREELQGYPVAWRPMQYTVRMSDGSIYKLDGVARDIIYRAASATGWSRFAEVEAEEDWEGIGPQKVRVLINVDQIASITVR